MKLNLIFKLILTVCISTGLMGCREGNSEEEKSFFSTESLGFESASEIKDPTNPEEVRSLLETNTSKAAQTELHETKELTKFYGSREYKPVWNNPNRREALVDALKIVDKEGLQYKDYHGSRIDELLDKSFKNSKERGELEIILTDAYFKLTDHLLRGKVNPEEMYNLWGIKNEPKDRAEALRKAINDGNITEAIDKLRPQHPVYRGLMVSLQEFKEKNHGITKIDEGGIINPGDTDERIPDIARRLKEMGYLENNVAIEGDKHTTEIQEAVKKLQKEHGIKVDGVVGPTTVEVLNIDNEERLKQILVNLERWRWYPRDLGDHYILVNIPDYKVAVIKNGDTVSTRKAIVGKEARETPIFTDTINHVVINPTWTVPPTIEQRDVIPNAKDNPDYFRSHNMIVYDENGNRINPEEIDWENPRQYTFQQQAGPNNPLGRVKIMYPNSFLVYIHDTPGKHRFNENTRAISSGCVRVENALGLAEYVLQYQPEWDRNRINEVVASGKTTHVNVEQEIVVHHLYYTAWRENGETKFTKDIYDLDDEVYNKLKQS